MKLFPAPFISTNLLGLAVKTVIVSTLGIGTLSAHAGGENPQGKPFVALQGEIVEVQGTVSSLQNQIDALVSDVETLEERVIADENAILDLLAADDALRVLIAQNATDIASINTLISEIEADNIYLEGLIADNAGDIDLLQADLAANTTLLLSLQSALLAVQNGLISLDTNLQSQIDNHALLIAALEEESTQIRSALDMKQNLVNGICPDGQAIQQVLDDGSVICESAGGGGALISTISMSWSGDVSPGGGQRVYASCPQGMVITGVGHFMNTPCLIPFHAFKDFASNRVALTVWNECPYTVGGWAQAICTGTAP